MRGCTCRDLTLCPQCHAWADKATVTPEKQEGLESTNMLQLVHKVTSPRSAATPSRALPTTHRIGGAGVMDTSHSSTPLFVQLPYQTPTITADHILCQTTIAGNPVTKGRARFYANKVYTPRKTRLAEKALQWALKTAFPQDEPNRSDDLGLSAIFYTRTKQRCDIDNFLKLLMDACTGLIWGDDLQVSEVSSKVVRGDQHPRIELMIYRLPQVP